MAGYNIQRNSISLRCFLLRHLQLRSEATTISMNMSSFDAVAKEKALQTESAAWDTSSIWPAESGDIPVVDVGDYFASEGKNLDALHSCAEQLRVACEQVGFYQLVGHGISDEDTSSVLECNKRFHDLPLDTKLQIRMDRDGFPLGGVGYIPVGNRKLPRRDKGNLNESFLIKSDHKIEVIEDNQWLPEYIIPGFQKSVVSYAMKMRSLALKLIPIYAVALGLDTNYFDDAFTCPFWRLRLSHYPPKEKNNKNPEIFSSLPPSFGIHPHVDTTFLTILLQSGPGLCIYSHPRQCWIDAAPAIQPGSLVVNSGELLKQWTNDRFLSVRHFANNPSDNDTNRKSRYSVPFFFNANSNYVMECLPTCQSSDNPPKYPPVSYEQSQASVQGE